ncbi:MAG: NUDIX domain-containing protein [Planctomycetaceae bacterium]|nr:NUDIX domain-containing protein [Planctomycetota bacterium]NUN52147.1 NUDIX domain-containing protein [Planctomycetaceae bacterium]
MAVEVCAAVILREGRVLVRRRPRGSHLEGAWEFPGGKRRPGERGRACAEREVLEETGLRVRAGEEVARVRHDYGDRVVAIRFFRCSPEGGRQRRSPLLRWVAPAALRRMRIPEANRGVVAALGGATSPASAPPAPPPR